MNLVYITTKFPPVAGGAGSVAYALAQAFSKEHNITVITEWAPGLKTRENINGIKIERIRMSPKSILSHLYFVANASLSVALKKADIIHFHDVTSGVCNAFLPKNMKAKKIMKYGGDFAYEYLSLRNIRGWNPAKGVEASWHFNAESKLAIRLEKYYLQKCDIVYSNSEYGVKLLEQLGIKNTKTIPNGIDLKIFAPQKYDRESIRKRLGITGKVFFAPARLMPWKGIDILIKAFRGTGKDNMLLIAGEGKEKGRLEALASGDSRIRFVGSVSWHDMPSYLCASDVFVMPSLFEWCPNALLEAMAMERMVIASDVGGIPEIIQDKKNGYLAEPANIEDLREKLEMTAEKKMLLEARKTIERKYSLQNMIKGIKKLYKG